MPIVTTGNVQSHLYNAWLAGLIEAGRAPGLWIEPRLTNVLIDQVLAALLRRFDAGPTERIVSCFAILNFFWAAFVYLSVTSRERADWFIPWLAALAYGYVFQLGLLNCYIAIGFSLWVLGLFERKLDLRRGILAVALTVLTILSHPIPAAWLIGTLGYRIIAARLSVAAQRWLFAGSVTSLILGRFWLTRHLLYQWNVRQFGMILGADQLVIYDWKYLFAAVPFAVTLLVMLWRALQSRQLTFGPRVQIFALTALAIAVLPTTMRTSPTAAWAGLIAERLSLLTPLLLLGSLPVPPPRLALRALAWVAVACFFSFLYVDLSVAARLEARMEALMQTKPEGERFVTYLWDFDPSQQPQPMLRRVLHKISQAVLIHGISLKDLLSRACIGRCFDYQNYEPATGQFRIRAKPGNSLVLATVQEIALMEGGYYVRKASDPPLHLLYRCGPERAELCLHSLEIGEMGRTIAEK
ncbi:MAG TPA: hypothetical protein VHM25_09870 [Polyangiaceae bacterium]|nr:hypothetical protein [Polyangiaceae bacterium]